MKGIEGADPEKQKAHPLFNIKGVGCYCFDLLDPSVAELELYACRDAGEGGYLELEDHVKDARREGERFHLGR